MRQRLSVPAVAAGFLFVFNAVATAQFAPPQITTASLPSWDNNLPGYNQSVGATGGAAPLTWSVASGTLPFGLQLNSATGAITGTPTQVNTFQFSIMVTDSESQTATRGYSVTINQVVSINNSPTLPSGAVNESYAQSGSTLGASWGSSPYTWSVPPNTLPAGLSLNASTGAITGIATAAGNYGSVSITVTDSLGQTATTAFSITINPQLAIAPVNLPVGVAGISYNGPALQASGGSSGYSWSLASGTVSNGTLAFQPGGSFSGTPAAPQTIMVTVRVTDQLGGTATMPVTLTINAPLSITTTANQIPAAVQGFLYNFQVQTAGGSGGNGWVVYSGSLPPGININNSGVLTGSTSAAPGNYFFQLRATDSDNENAVSPMYSLLMTAPVAITTTTLPNGAFGDTYSQTINTIGGTGNFTWSISGGALPAGVGINPTTGVISGTAMQNGFPPNTSANINVTVQVVDAAGGSATQFFDFLVNPTIAVSTAIAPAAVAGDVYSATLAVSGGSGTFLWSITPSNALPTGLSLTDPVAGVISGTASVTGSFPFTATVTDSNGGAANKALTLYVNAAGKVITSNLLPGMAIVNVSGTQDGAGSYNGDQTIWYSPFSTTGHLLEYTVQPGTYTFRIIDPADAQGVFPSLTAGQANSMWTSWTYNSPWVTSYLAFDSSAATNSSVGQIFSGAEWAGFTGPTATLDAYNAAISNGVYNELFVGTRNSQTPVKQYHFANTETLIFAVPDYGLGDNQGGVSVLIAPVASALVIPGQNSVSSLPAGQAGTPYGGFTLTASGGSGVYRWSNSPTNGPLPAGMSISPGGAIGGTPTVMGTFTHVLLTVTDPVSGASQSILYSLQITGPANPLTITTSSPLPGAHLNLPYSQTIAAMGGLGAYSWTLTPIGASSGLAINASTGALTGEITTPGTYTFAIGVSDTANDTTSQNFTVSALGITTSSLPIGTQNQPYLGSVSATGGSGNYSWSILSQSAGLNLAIDSAGNLTGTPTSSNTDNGLGMAIRVTDNITTQTATQSFSIVVLPGAPPGPQPVGTTIYSLDESGALDSVTGGASHNVTEFGGCSSECLDMARAGGGNFVVARGGSLAILSAGGALIQTIPATEEGDYFSVAVDGQGNYIVADTANRQLLRISPVSPFASDMVGSWTVPEGSVHENAYVRVDGSGNYVLTVDDGDVDNDQPSLRVFTSTPAGPLVPLALTGSALPSSSGGLTFDANGNYVDIDWWSHTIFTITPAGVTTELYTNPHDYLYSPRGITRDPASGDFIIADDDLDAIFSLTPDGQVLSQIAQYGALGIPGAVLVADTVPQNAIDYVLTDSDPGAIVPVGGGVTLNCSACGGFVSDFAIDAQGNFIVASEEALVKITPGGGACPTGCAILTPVNGQNFFSVAIDQAGNYIVGDNNNHQVLRVAPGSPATITASIPYTVSEFEDDSYEDVYIRIDGAGNYVVAEDNDEDDPVNIFVIPPGATSSPDPLTLTPGLPLTSIPTTYLGGMTLDATGRYVITDDDNGQVYVVSQAGAFSILYDNSAQIFSELGGIYLDPFSGNFLLTDYDNGNLYTMDQTGHQINLVQSGFESPVVAISYPTALTVISSTTLPGGTANQFYSTGFLAQGGSGNYSWSATGLPGTLSMSTAGVISGTPTAAFSSNNIVVTVTDLSNNNATAMKTFSLTIIPGLGPLPMISGLLPSAARAGGPAFTLTVNGSGFVSGATIDWGSTALSTAFVNASQLTASVNPSLIASPGPVNVTVVNPGPIASGAVTFTVNPSTLTTTMLLTSASPVGFGQAVTLTANVAPSAATGKVTFYDGTSVLGIGTLTGGVAHVTTSLLPAGSGNLKAYYAGDVSYAPSISGPTPQTVNANASGTLVPVGGNPFLVGFTPCALVTGDFDRNGIPDLAVANNEGGNVAIFLGTGSGTFNEASDSPHRTGTGPCSVAVADFNGDGIQDIAVGNQNTNNITVLLGTGTGAFNEAAGSPFPAGSNPFVTVGDFNGDGIPDLATANFGGNNVTVLLGDGMGGFNAAQDSPFPAGVNPVAIVVGDFNGDGKADIATANFGGDNVTVLLGTGLGGFNAAQGSPFPAGTSPRALAIGDFTGNHVSDLAIANESGNNVTVLLGTGLGGFNAAPGSPFPAGTNPFSVAVGDLNGDGIQDLAFTSSNTDVVTVLLGTGGGSFRAALGAPLPTESSPVSIVTADFNHDGVSDLAVANEDSNSVTIFLGGSASTTSLLTTTSPASIAPGTAVPLTLGVSDTISGFNAPTGTATFSDGGTVLGVALQSASPYTFNAAGLGVGAHTLTATYSGDTRTQASTSNIVTINVVPPTPTVSGLSPFSATAGGTAFTLTVNGQSFVSGAVVQWNGTALTTTFVSGAQLTASVSAGLIASAGSAAITVTNPGGAASAPATFTIPPTPTVTSLTPSSVYANSPATITISGSNFVAGDTVSVTPPGGTAMLITPNQVQATQISATIPGALLATAGSAVIAIQNGAGTLSNNVRLTIVPAGAAPTISGLSPYSVTAGGPAFTLFVAGTNFVAGATVQWGGTALSTTLAGSTQLTASVSAAQIATSGPVSVTVVNAGPVTSAPFAFDVQAPTGQTWMQLTTSGTPPAPRDLTRVVFDPPTTQMILFGGYDANLNELGDTWSLNTTTNQWSQLAPAGTAPPARASLTTVYDSANSRMTIFGGQQSSGCLNDVWTLSNANGSAGTPTWTQLSPTGTPPPPRTDHEAVYDPVSNRMIVFAGDNSCPPDYSGSASYNDVWVLTNANGLGGTPAWTQLAPTGTLPSARDLSSVVYDPASNTMIVFGGAGTTNLSDVWILSHANGLGGTPAWTQLAPAGGTIPARFGHTAVYDPGLNRMTVFGGWDNTIGRLEIFSDTWVLTNANNAGGIPTWTQLAPSGAIPTVRTTQAATLDPTTNRMIIFGGSGFTGNLNDVWTLSDENGVTSISSLSPPSAAAGGPAFTLTVNGQGFAPGAVVNWNGGGLTTTFVSTVQLTASVGAGLITTVGSANVTVANPGGATSAPATFTISPSAPVVQPLVITSGAPPSTGTVGVGYGSFTFTASGGSGGYLWAVSGVPGVTVNASTGALSGVPTSAGSFTLTVMLSDAGNSLNTISQNYGVTIAGVPLSITTSSLPGGIENQPYSATLAASGGSGSYTFSVSGIAGLSVTGNRIGGSPTAGGNLTLTVTVSDALNPATPSVSRQFAVSITFVPLTITTPGALGEFAAGAAISTTFGATGGSPAYTWSATGVPASMTLNSATGQLTGTAPGTPGNYSFPLRVSDTQTPAASDSTTVTLSVLGFTTPGTLPSGTTSTTYSLTFVAAGGTPPYSFSSPAPPAGLTLSSSGFLTGKPASAGTTSFKVLVTDASGISPIFGNFSLTVATGVQPVQVTGAALPDGALTTSYSQPLEAQNGQPGYNWTLLGGTLPPGLVLNSSGTISGTPTASGQATFTARATDAAGGFAAAVFTININPATLQVTAAALQSAMAGLPYGAQPINATGGVPPYTFAITQGSLPAPLTFGSGQINGGVPAAAGTSDFTVTATDAVGNTASGSFTLLVEPTHPDLILSQGAVSFAIVTGAAVLPAAANVTVGSSVGSSLAYNVTVNPAAPWLDVTPGGSTPGSVTIALDAANAPPLGIGIYQTTVSVACPPLTGCSGSHDIAVSLTVTSPAPQLSLGTNLLSFTATGNGSQTLAQPLNLQNSGGGTVTIQSVSAADSWVKFDPATIPPPPVALGAGQTLQVSVFADATVLSGPGYYQSTITVTTDAGSATVPVTLLIAANATMTLSPAGSQFNTVAGNAPGNSSGSFLVSVSGNSTVNWTAAILPTSPAASWLTLNTPSGLSTSANPGTVSFAINASAAGLAAQAYYATIEVTATGGGVSNPVQDYQVILNVAPAGDIAAPNPNPSGLIFISTGPGGLPAQIVAVGSSSGGVTYAAQSDSPSWLAVSPASGITSSAAPGQSSVSVNLAGLANGVYHGGIDYAIAGQVRTVNVTLVVAAPAAGPAVSGVSGKASQGCTATQLIPAQTGLVNNFSLPTAWPTPLQINVIDDCGKAVTNGQVVTTFSNGDPPLVLPSLGGKPGVYSGTWTPRATASQVTITAQASALGFKPASVAITGQVTRNGAPILNSGGTLNAFVPVVGSPLAPGMIVQIYGSNLASSTVVSSTIPLTTSLNNTSVIIGGQAAPLYFVSPGQINAQVPFGLTPGTSYEVIVNANGALSTPNAVQLAGDAPGIAAFASGGIIAEHGADGSLVTEDSPAAPGEYVVFFVSGMGATDNPVVTGAASPGSPGLARPTDQPTLTLNGANVPVAFAGMTPTLVGLYQVNFQVPANAPNGDLILVLTQTGGASNSTVLPVHATK